MSRGTWKPPIGGKQRHEKDTSYPNKVLTYRHRKQTHIGRATTLERGGFHYFYEGENSGMTGHRLCIACYRFVICCW